MYYYVDYDELIIISVHEHKIIQIEDVNSNTLPLTQFIDKIIDINKYIFPELNQFNDFIFYIKSKAIDKLVHRIIYFKLNVKINFDSYIKIYFSNYIRDRDFTVEYFQSCGKINGYCKEYFNDSPNFPIILIEYIDGKDIKIIYKCC